MGIANLNRIIGHAYPGSIMIALIYRCKISDQKKLISLLKKKRLELIEKSYIAPQPPILLQSKEDEQIVMEIMEWKSKRYLNNHKLILKLKILIPR